MQVVLLNAGEPRPTPSPHRQALWRSLQWRIALVAALLSCCFHGVGEAATGGQVGREAIIEFGTPSKLLRKDDSAGTYNYEKQYFRVTGPFRLEIGRDPKFLALGITYFHVKVISADPKEDNVPISMAVVRQMSTETASASFEGFPHGTYLVELRLDASVREMMNLKIFPAQTNPPPPAHSFLVKVQSISQGDVIADPRPDDFVRTATGQSSCTPTFASHATNFELERVAEISPSAALTNVPTVRLFASGREIQVKVPDSWTSPRNVVHITVEAKKYGDSEYLMVCDRRMVSTRNSQFVAHSSTKDEWLDWRVETNFEHASELEISGSIAIAREKYLSPPPQAVGNLSTGKEFAFICYGAETAQVAADGNTEFARSFRLDIKIDDRKHELSTPQLEEVRRQTLSGAQIWNRACTTCQPLNLSIITVDGENYAHAAIAQWTTNLIRVPLYSEFVEKSLEFAKGQNRVGTVGISFPYQPIGPLDTAFRDICNLPEPHGEPLLSDLRRQVCPARQQDPHSVTRIQVRFVPGETACGDSKNIIACRADNELTEFNTRDYKFVFDDKSLTPIGIGRLEIDFSHALLHEMGHWIGLAHIDIGKSIMASSLEHSRCIDASTVSKLTQTVSTKSWGVSSPAAFTYEGNKP